MQPERNSEKTVELPARVLARHAIGIAYEQDTVELSSELSNPEWLTQSDVAATVTEAEYFLGEYVMFHGEYESGGDEFEWECTLYVDGRGEPAAELRIS